MLGVGNGGRSAADTTTPEEEAARPLPIPKSLRQHRGIALKQDKRYQTPETAVVVAGTEEEASPISVDLVIA